MTQALSSGGAIILDEEVTDFEPSEQELQEYAAWLGIDVDKDPDLLWIARSGLKSAVPPPWKACQADNSDDIFYFNFETGESVWDHPCDEHHRKIFKRELAKKYGNSALADSDDPAECSNTSVSLGSVSGEVDDSTKHNKKEGREKKEKKEKKAKKDSDRLMPMSAPKDLAPLGDIKGKAGLPLGVTSAMKGSAIAAEKSPDKKDKKTTASKAGKDDKNDKRLASDGDALQHQSSKASACDSEDEAIRGKSGCSATSCAAVSAAVQETPGQSLAPSLREGSEKQRLDREMQEWIAAEEAKAKAEQQSKLAKMRKELETEFERDRDLAFGELEKRNQQQIREEKQRLTQELAAQLDALQAEGGELRTERLRMLEKARADLDNLLLNKSVCELHAFPERKRHTMLRDSKLQSALLSAGAVVEMEALLNSRSLAVLQFAQQAFVACKGGEAARALFEKARQGVEASVLADAMLERDSEGNVPLHYCRDVNAVKYFMELSKQATSVKNVFGQRPVHMFLIRHPSDVAGLKMLAADIAYLLEPDEYGISPAMHTQGAARKYVDDSVASWASVEDALNKTPVEMLKTLESLRPLGSWCNLLAFHIYGEDQVWRHSEHTKTSRSRVEVVFRALEAAFVSSSYRLARKLLEATKGPRNLRLDPREPCRSKLAALTHRLDCDLGARIADGLDRVASSGDSAAEWLFKENPDELEGKLTQSPWPALGLTGRPRLQIVPPSWALDAEPDFRIILQDLKSYGQLGAEMDHVYELMRMSRTFGTGTPSEVVDRVAAWYCAWLRGVCVDDQANINAALEKYLSIPVEGSSFVSCQVMDERSMRSSLDELYFEFKTLYDFSGDMSTEPLRQTAMLRRQLPSFLVGMLSCDCVVNSVDSLQRTITKLRESPSVKILGCRNGFLRNQDATLSLSAKQPLELKLWVECPGVARNAVVVEVRCQLNSLAALREGLQLVSEMEQGRFDWPHLRQSVIYGVNLSRGEHELGRLREQLSKVGQVSSEKTPRDFVEASALESLRAQVEERTGEVLALKAETDKVRSERDEQKQECERLTASIKQTELDGASAIEVFAKQLEDRDAEIVKLRESIKNEQSDADKGELLAMKQAHERLRGDAEAAREELSAAKEQYSETLASIETKQLEIESLTKRCAHLSSELDQQESRAAEVERDKGKSVTLDEHTKMIEMERIAATTKWEELSRLLESERQDARVKLEEHLHLLKTERAASKSMLDASQALVDRCSSDVKEARGDASLARAELARLKILCESREAECQRLADDIALERKAVAQVRSVADVDSRNLQVTSAELATMTRECERLRANALNSYIVADEIESLRSELKKEQSATTRALTETAATARGLAIVKEELDGKQLCIQQMQASHAESSRLLNDEVEKSQQLYFAERNLAAQARSEASSAARDLAILRTELDTRTADCKRLHEKIAESGGITGAEFKRVLEQLEDERRKNVETSSKSASAAYEIATLQAELETQIKHVAQLRVQLSDASSNVDNTRLLQGLLDEANRAAAEAKAQSAIVQRELLSLKAAGQGLAESVVEQKRLQSRLTEHQAAGDMARAELEATRTKLQAVQSECSSLKEQLEEADRKRLVFLQQEHEYSKLLTMQGQLEEEKSKNSQMRTAASVAAARAEVEIATLRAELDARSSECGRLRADLLQNVAASSSDADLRSLASLRSQVAEQRAELERLRQLQAKVTAPVATCEEELYLRTQIKDRDEVILGLKADAAHVVARHVRELEDLRAKLAEGRIKERQRQADNVPDRVADLQTQLRAQACEIERLHIDSSGMVAEADRLRSELRSANNKLASAEATFASSFEQKRREIQRLEEIGRDREGEILALKDQCARNKHVLLRSESDEQRAAKRIESAQDDVELARQETLHVKQQLADLERLLDDARAASRAVQIGRGHLEEQMRDGHREVRSLREQLSHVEIEYDKVQAEARRYRAELADRDLDISRLHKQLISFDAEGRQERVRGEGSAPTVDAWSQVGNRMRALDEREQAAKDREGRILEAEVLLNERMRRAREDVQQSRTSPAIVSNGICLETNVAADACEATIPSQEPFGVDVIEDGPVDIAPAAVGVEAFGCDLRTSSPRLHNLSSRRPLFDSPALAPDTAGMSAFVDREGEVGSGFASDVIVSEASALIESKRRALKRERAELEGLQRKWREDCHHLRSVGDSQASTVLLEVRMLLDGRAAVLNHSIEELRTLEKALALSPEVNPKKSRSISARQSRPSKERLGIEVGPIPELAGLEVDNYAAKSRCLSARAPRTTLSHSRDDFVEEDLSNRWRHILGSRGQGVGSSVVPFSRVEGIMSSLPTSYRGQRLLDSHFQYLRGLGRETGISKLPFTARAHVY